MFELLAMLALLLLVWRDPRRSRLAGRREGIASLAERYFFWGLALLPIARAVQQGMIAHALLMAAWFCCIAWALAWLFRVKKLGARARGKR